MPNPDGSPTLSELLAQTPVPNQTWATTASTGTGISIKKTANLIRPRETEEENMPPLMAKEGFTFGCDPEVFIKNADGVYVSAAGLLPGTKEAPHDMGDGTFIQVDGMAAEIGITPAEDFTEFNARIGKALKNLERLLPDGHTWDAIPFVRFNEDIFEAAPEEAKCLGCHPDFDAWTGDVNPPPGLEHDPRLRCAGGHIHVGWTKDADLTDPQHLMNCRDLVKQLDWFLGGWSVKMDPDPTRRQLYGKAGACRYKDYGVEYRTLGNFWITTRERRLVVWNRLQEAIRQMSKLYIPDVAGVGYSQQLQKVINEGTYDPYLQKVGRYPLNTINAYECRF